MKWFIETLPPKIKEGDIIDVILNNGQWAISYKKATYPISDTPGNRTLGRSTYKAVVLEGGYPNIIRYSDLHRHSDYSLLDGMTTVETMAAKGNGYHAIIDALGEGRSCVTLVTGVMQGVDWMESDVSVPVLAECLCEMGYSHSLTNSTTY